MLHKENPFLCGSASMNYNVVFPGMYFLKALAINLNAEAEYRNFNGFDHFKYFW